MQLPIIGKGAVQSLGGRSPSEIQAHYKNDNSVKLISLAANTYKTYIDNKDKQNTKNLGVGLSKRLAAAKLKLSQSESISKSELSTLGVQNFDSDLRDDIPSYEASPFIKKSIIDTFVSHGKNTFSTKELGDRWSEDISTKGLLQFSDELTKTNKIIKEAQVESLKSEINIAQSDGDFGLSTSLIKQLPSKLHSDYNHDNTILKEKHGINVQMATGSDEELQSTLNYLKDKDYEGLPSHERMSAIRGIRAELSKRSSIRKSKKKAEDIVISRAISELSKSIKKGDQDSFEALDTFSSKVDFDSLSQKQQLDLRKTQELRNNIQDLRALSSSTDRSDYVSKMCKSGDKNCNDMKSIHNKDIKLMSSDPMQYAVNAKIVGFGIIDFENDSDIEIAKSVIQRIKSKELITQYIGHETKLLTNNESDQYNNKLKNMKPEAKVSQISSMLNLVGDEAFVILSEQVSGKINSNYYIAKSLMLGNSEVSISIANGIMKQNLVSNELKQLIKANVTKRIFDRSEFIPAAVASVASLMAEEISKSGDYKDSSIETDDIFFNNVDTVDEFVEQVIGRKENIHGSIITLPNMKITNMEMQDTLNNINPDSLDIPFSQDITQKDIADGLKSNSLLDFLSDSKYILKDTSIPGVYFVADRITGGLVRGQNKKAYRYDFNSATTLDTELDKDKKIFEKIKSQTGG